MPSAQENAARKKVIEQLRRSTAEKKARAEAKKAKADANGKKHDQNEMTKSASDSDSSGVAMPRLGEIEPTVDVEEGASNKPDSSKAKSPSPQPSVPRTRPRLPVSKPKPKSRRRQEKPEERWWEPKPDQGLPRKPAASILIENYPRSNCFAGLHLLARKPLASKDSNSQGVKNVGTVKRNIEKVDAPELGVTSSKKPRLEGDSGSLSTPSHGKRKVGGDHDRGPTTKKCKVDHTSSVKPAEHQESRIQGVVGPGSVENSAPQNSETLPQGLDSQSRPNRLQRKRQIEDEEDTQPPPKRAAVFQTIGNETIDNGYMKPAIQRRKLGKRPRGLYNHKGACFMNAATQALHSVKEIATMDERKTLRDLFPKRLGEYAPEMLQEATKGRKRAKMVVPLAEYLAEKARLKQLQALKHRFDRPLLTRSRKIRPYWVNLMRQMSSHREDQVFNPVLFQQVSGALFTGAEGPMNGDSQEDVYDFMQKLLPEIDANGLFEAVFDCKKSCRNCGEEKLVSATRAELLLKIPETMKRSESKVELEFILGNCLKDHSIFEFEKLECEGCKEIGQWDDAKGWKGQKGSRLSKVPEYLFTQIPRCDYATVATMRNNQDGSPMVKAKMTKVRSQVLLPTGDIRIPYKDGDNVEYELVAVIEHRGKDFQSGHFTTTRIVDGHWFTCDDDEVTEIKRRELQQCTQATVCLFRRAGF